MSTSTITLERGTSWLGDLNDSCDVPCTSGGSQGGIGVYSKRAGSKGKDTGQSVTGPYGYSPRIDNGFQEEGKCVLKVE